MIFLKKLRSHLKAIWVAFCMFLKLFEIIYLLRLGSYLKELSSNTSLGPYYYRSSPKVKTSTGQDIYYRSSPKHS